MTPPPNDSKSQKNTSDELKEKSDTVVEQENKIARLENDIKKLGDKNAGPRVIQKGNQKHPEFQKNDIVIPATIPKKKPETK